MEISPKDIRLAERYQAIADALTSEIDLAPSERDLTYEETTWEVFRFAGLSQLEHQTWRDEEMLSAMHRLHRKRFIEKNPLLEIERDLKSNNPNHNTSPWYTYCQEIDEEGRSLEELAQKAKPRYPEHTRRQLEFWAAEEYVRRRDANTSLPLLKTMANTEQTCSQESNQTTGNTRAQANPTRDRAGNLRKITREDILSEDHTAIEIARELLSRYPSMAAVNLPEELAKALGDAAYQASRGTKKGRIDPPIRIHKRKDGKWHWVALTFKGESGRGSINSNSADDHARGNRYGIIKEDGNSQSSPAN